MSWSECCVLNFMTHCLIFYKFNHINFAMISYFIVRCKRYMITSMSNDFFIRKHWKVITDITHYDTICM